MPSPRDHHARKRTPQGSGKRTPVWNVDELNRLFAVARQTEGDVGTIPARLWWPALLLAIIDTAIPYRELLATRRTDYHPQSGNLSVGLLTYTLSPRTADAVNAICDDGGRRSPSSAPTMADRLFPWPWDNGKDFYTLARHFEQIVKDAELPRATRLFDALRIAARQQRDIVESLDLSHPFVPKIRRPRRPKRQKGSHCVPETSLLGISLSNNLFEFFDRTYAPQRLTESSHDTVMGYRRALVEFSWFLASDPTFHNLDEDTVERFLVWMKRTGRSNATINKYTRYLLAIWNYAWKKRRVSDQPRDIRPLPESKRIPDAWSAEQMGRILAAARQTEGTITDIPARDWWPALLLTDYDTGLRIDALMQARVSDYDASTRWLKIPAEVQKQDADQVFRLHPDTIAAIEATNPSTREHLFPWPLIDHKYKFLRTRYRRILAAAGLGTSRHDTFHKLRRTSATAVCNAFDRETAQRHLGHSHPSVTARYLDPRLIVPKHNTAADAIARPWAQSTSELHQRSHSLCEPFRGNQ